MQIFHNNKLILTGPRDPSTKLWKLPLFDTTSNKISTIISQHNIPNNINSITQTDNTSQMVNFYHATAFSPTKSTFIKAIQRGFLQSWPGLTTKNVQKYLQSTLATGKGHLDQTRKNQRSTTKDEEEQPTQENNNEATNILLATIQTIDKVYSDQTGRFPYISSRGYKYIFILYSYDSNAILALNLRSRQDKDILNAYDSIHNLLVQRGFPPKIHWLDNEASHLLKQHHQSNQINFQLTPPYVHRRNAAERAIRTWKNHFIAGLSSVNTNFPLHLWDRLIPQATMTLNMMRPSRRNHHMSAHTALYGEFNFDSHPMAPPGTKILIHEKSSKRATWAPHGQEGWYLGPAMDHYRCYSTFVNKTRTERISDTIQFYHHNVTIPTISSSEHATRAAEALTDALVNPPSNSPIQHIGKDKMRALQQLASYFKQYIKTNDVAEPRVQENLTPKQHCLEKETHTDTQTRVHRYPTRERHNALLQSKMPCINTVIDQKTGDELEYKQLIARPDTKAQWQQSFTNELGRLAQGQDNNNVGTNTINFIPFDNIPTDRRKDITYGRIVVEYKLHKDEPHRTRLTVGGNQITYPGIVTTPTADIATAKLLINSIISTPKARFMTIDIGNFYLGTPMSRPEYMSMPLSIIPPHIVKSYQLGKLTHNDKIYIQINKGMYGLPQAGRLAHQQLIKFLQPHAMHHVHTSTVYGDMIHMI